MWPSNVKQQQHLFTCTRVHTHIIIHTNTLIYKHIYVDLLINNDIYAFNIIRLATIIVSILSCFNPNHR